MTNLEIELLLLIIVLVNFGTILTAKIYSQSVKEIQRKRLFCSESNLKVMIQISQSKNADYEFSEKFKKRLICILYLGIKTLDSCI